MPTTKPEIDIDAIHGTAVLLLDTQGNAEAAELLELAELKYGENWSAEDVYDPDGYPQVEWLTPTLHVDPHLFGAYTEDIVKATSAALEAVTRLEPYGLNYPVIVPKRVAGDWRTARQQERLAGVNNQAHRQPLDKPHPVVDGLHFRTPEEVLVYDALVALQRSRPKTDTICIAVNAPVRVAGRTVVPDFLVTLRARVGVIEVDGGTHQRRFLADASRNDLLTDGGFSLVYRIPAEDTANPDEIRAHLETFIARLLSR